MDGADVISAGSEVVLVRGWQDLSPERRDALAESARAQHEAGELIRGAVCSVMSPGSRRRLLLTMAEGAGHLSVGTTAALTYGRDGRTAEAAKRDLKALRKRLRRSRWGGRLAVLWVLEWQARGAPHFHLVIGGLRPGERHAFGEWLRSAWLAITGAGGSPEAAREAYGVLLVDVYLFGGLAGYFVGLLGESAKASQKVAPVDRPGRWWGVLDRAAWAEACEAYPATVGPLRLDRAAIRDRMCEVGALLWPGRQGVWIEALGEVVRVMPGLLVGDAAGYVVTGDRAYLVSILARRERQAGEAADGVRVRAECGGG